MERENMENEVASPLGAIRSFLEKQPTEVQEDLCFLTLALMPGELMATDKPLSRIFKWIEEKDQESDMHVAGAAVMLRSLFDFAAMDFRGTDEGWDEVERTAKWALKRSQEENVGIDVSERVLAGIPARRKIWLSTTAEWRELCLTELSNAAINAWWKKQFISK